jgi:peptidoglycan hydrolase-like protein with peptidoglycan-binding domain
MIYKENLIKWINKIVLSFIFLNLIYFNFINVNALIEKDEYYIGQRDQKVSDLQRFLNNKGYFKYKTITGYYGPLTDEALRNYRLDNNIIKTITSDCKSKINDNYQTNITNNKNKDLQNCFYEMGWLDKSFITGFYGPITYKLHSKAQELYKNTNINIKNLYNLVNAGKITAPTSPPYSLLESYEKKLLNQNLVSLLLYLTEYYENINLVSIYRPYDGGWPKHSQGLALDVASFTKNNVVYTSQSAVDGDPQALSNWIEFANHLKNSQLVDTVITAKTLAQNLYNQKGFQKSQITGSTSKISVLTVPDGSNPTIRHEDHIHIEVTPKEQNNNRQDQMCIKKDKQFKIGEQNSAVKDLQYCLIQKGFFDYSGGATSYYGSNNDIICPIIIQWSFTDFDNNPVITKLQQCLKEKNLFNYPAITGIYGPITKQGHKKARE